MATGNDTVDGLIGNGDLNYTEVREEANEQKGSPAAIVPVRVYTTMTWWWGFTRMSPRPTVIIGLAAQEQYEQALREGGTKYKMRELYVTEAFAAAKLQDKKAKALVFLVWRHLTSTLQILPLKTRRIHTSTTRSQKLSANLTYEKERRKSLADREAIQVLLKDWKSLHNHRNSSTGEGLLHYATVLVNSHLDEVVSDMRVNKALVATILGNFKAYF